MFFGVFFFVLLVLVVEFGIVFFMEVGVGNREGVMGGGVMNIFLIVG